MSDELRNTTLESGAFIATTRDVRALEFCVCLGMLFYGYDSSENMLVAVLSESFFRWHHLCFSLTDSDDDSPASLQSPSSILPPPSHRPTMRSKANAMTLSDCRGRLSATSAIVVLVHCSLIRLVSSRSIGL